MIAVALSAFGNVANSILNTVSLVGLIYFSSYEIIDEKRAIPGNPQTLSI